MSLGDNKVWELERIDEKLLGTFSGSTDMLLRCMTYVLADPSAEVPVEEKVDWGEKTRIGKTARKINLVSAVDLTGTGSWPRSWLRTLATKSTVGTGRRWKTSQPNWLSSPSPPSLPGVTSIGMGSSIWQAGTAGTACPLAQGDGTFAAANVQAGDALKHGCLSLSILDVGQHGKPACWSGRRLRP